MAVDVVGYSRLMGADEEGTLVALKAIRRELGDPKIAEHRGRIVKTTGDGTGRIRQSSMLCAALSRCSREWPGATPMFGLISASSSGSASTRATS
jgi:class 3 adenylate cyclase